jgi:hypothetical protein
MTTLAEIVREHRNGDGFATDMMHRLRAGELIDGVNSASCNDGCGAVIVWENHDEVGPEWKQPDGFRCECCDEWCDNKCGNRAEGVCGSCVLLQRTQDFLENSKEIEAATYKKDYAAIPALLLKGVALEREIGRRSRIISNRKAA